MQIALVHFHIIREMCCICHRLEELVLAVTMSRNKVFLFDMQRFVYEWLRVNAMRSFGYNSALTLGLLSCWIVFVVNSIPFHKIDSIILSLLRNRSHFHIPLSYIYKRRKEQTFSTLFRVTLKTFRLTFHCLISLPFVFSLNFCPFFFVLFFFQLFLGLCVDAAATNVSFHV